MTAKNQSNIRLACYILSLLGMLGVSIYSRGGDAAVLESRVKIGDEWRKEHRRVTEESARMAAKQDKFSAILGTKYDNITLQLSEINRRLGNIEMGPTAACPPVPRPAAWPPEPELYGATAPE